MVKRFPLRIAAKSVQSVKSDSHESSRKNRSEKRPQRSGYDDDEAYWEQVERDDQVKKKKKTSVPSVKPKESKPVSDHGDDSNISESDSSSEEQDGIPLGKTVEHISEQYTFEFNDMRESFTEGVCTLLRSKFIPNPTTAYHVACDITSQTVVGTAIVCEGGDDVFAFATVLPMVKQQSGTPFHSLLQTLAGK